MFNFKCGNLKKLEKLVKSEKSFVLTGLTSFFRLFLLNKIIEYSKKKVLFVTSSEQSALRYKNDYKKLFNNEI